MATRRILFDTLGAFLLALSLLVLGRLVAVPLTFAIASSVGINELIVTSPADIVWIRAKLALALALLPCLAWVVALIFRIRSAAEPAAGQLALYLAIPALALVVGLALHVLALRAALGEGHGLLLTIKPALSGLLLVRWGIELSVLAGAVLATVVAIRAHKRERAD